MVKYNPRGHAQSGYMDYRELECTNWALSSLGQGKKNWLLCIRLFLGSHTKGSQRNYQLNGNLFTCTQSNTRISQVMLTLSTKGDWKKSYNGRVGRQGTGQHKSKMRSHRGNHFRNNGPHRTTSHSTDKCPHHGSSIHVYIIKICVDPRWQCSYAHDHYRRVGIP